jgi:hypothetical protein
MSDHAAKAREYRERAAAELTAGGASPLDQVRDKHARAAQVWTSLADAEDARLADKTARALAAVPKPA